MPMVILLSADGLLRAIRRQLGRDVTARNLGICFVATRLL